MSQLHLFALFVALFYCCTGEEIPDFIKVCKRNDPEMLKCFIETGELIKPHLAHGIPEYGIPALEPLNLNEGLNENSTGLFITTSNVKAWGASNFVPKDLHFDFETQTYSVDILIPLLQIEADYHINGKILLVPMHGEGPFEMNITNCYVKATLTGELYQGDEGQTHLKFTDMALKVDVEAGRIRFENLFNGDKFLNTVINDTVNKNFKFFLAEIMPIAERALTPTFKNIANGIVTRFTYDQLFPL